ncbi:uncharacterized protein V6R79_000726 [Siganus canaliculatus]
MCASWLLVVMTMAHLCVPGSSSVCWESSICNDLTNKGKILDCIHLCTSVIQTKVLPDEQLALKDSDNKDLLLSILLATMVSENKISQTDLQAHNDQRRSYSMEHFRWGKPPGRKRRPVKVFASLLEEGRGSSDGGFPSSQTRRQLSVSEDEAKADLKGDDLQTQGLLRPRASSKSVSSQQRKDGTYRMSHFRWGSPTASKRTSSFMKTWEEKPQRQLARLFRNILGRGEDRGEEEEGWLVQRV